MILKVKFQSDILCDQRNQRDEPVLNDFVENESIFDDLRYIISYKNNIRRDFYDRENDFCVYHGQQSLFHHIIKAKRFFGNSKLVKCSNLEISLRRGLKRLIRINEEYYFMDSMLFVQASGETYRLKDNFGFLQLHIPQRQSIKIL